MPEQLEVRLPPDAISATFDCSICGHWAMRVVTFPTADPGATFPTIVTRRPGWVVAESALGSNGLAISEVAEGRGPIDIEGAIRRADPAELYAIDRELVPMWCRDCARVYCHDHWTVWMTFDPDFAGWYEDTRGRCPEGHERILDD
jgi:hypothetical protein